MKKIDGITKESTQEMIDKALEVYPGERRKRSVRRTWPPTTASGACVKSNRKTVPGVMSARGCAYAGAKGVVWGPIRDMVHVSHGPVGCGWYSWGTRRNLMIGHQRGQPVRHAVHLRLPGKGHRLRRRQEARRRCCMEAKELFPLAKGISVLSECPVGLIGDDINSVAKQSVQGTRHPDHPLQLRGVPRRLPVARPPHLQRHHPRLHHRTREFAEPARPTTSPSSATTTSAATSGRRSRCWRRSASTSRPSGPATARWRRSPPPTR